MLDICIVPDCKFQGLDDENKVEGGDPYKKKAGIRFLGILHIRLPKWRLENVVPD